MTCCINKTVSIISDPFAPQGLVMLLSAGIGIFASNFVFDAVIGSFGWMVAFAVALSLAVLGKLLTLLLMR